MCSLAIVFHLLLVIVLAMAHDDFRAQDKAHMKEHLQGTVDFDNLTIDEMKFHYFRVHDVDGNNKMDGCELLQSLLHSHSEESMVYGVEQSIFTDYELSSAIDGILESDDKNFDGFLDYTEYIAGQISRDF